MASLESIVLIFRDRGVPSLSRREVEALRDRSTALILQSSDMVQYLFCFLGKIDQSDVPRKFDTSLKGVVSVYPSIILYGGYHSVPLKSNTCFSSYLESISLIKCSAGFEFSLERDRWRIAYLPHG